MKKLDITSLLFSAMMLFFVACDEDDIIPEVPTGNSGTPAPAALAGQSVNLEFTTAIMGAPYQLGDTVLFTFANDGSMTIDQDPNANNGNEVIVSSYTTVGSELVWEDAANGFKYALSFQSDSSINEVNVSSLSNAFLGQFTPLQAVSNELAIIQGMAGNYTVTNVSKGTHNRMSVSIASNGSIDFDTGISLDVADYELISDRISVLNGIWIDMKPYPTQNYPRMHLYVKAGTQQLERLDYYPQYPSVSGRVEVSVQ